MIYNNNKPIFSAVILAAGNSSRMGVPKMSLKFNAKSNFLENIVSEILTCGADEIVVVVNAKANFQKDFFATKFVVNTHPDWGRFHSLKLGLNGVKNIEKVLIINVDNPFINAKVIDNLVMESNDIDFVYPTYEGKGGHPFLINKKVVTSIINESNIHFNLKEFLKSFNGKSIHVLDEKILANINTKEDYEKFFG